MMAESTVCHLPFAICTDSPYRPIFFNPEKIPYSLLNPISSNAFTPVRMP